MGNSTLSTSMSICISRMRSFHRLIVGVLTLALPFIKG